MAKNEVVKERRTESLMCSLTAAEFKSRAIELAKVDADMSSTEDRHEAMKQTIKSEIASLEARRSKLSGIVAAQAELREIEVEIRHNYDTCKVFKTRLDTGEIFGERNMTTEERQTALPLAKEAAH